VTKSTAVIARSLIIVTDSAGGVTIRFIARAKSIGKFFRSFALGT
jgi:hypothetical protein